MPGMGEGESFAGRGLGWAACAGGGRGRAGAAAGGDAAGAGGPPARLGCGAVSAGGWGGWGGAPKPAASRKHNRRCKKVCMRAKK